MKILVCGSRAWENWGQIWDTLHGYPHDSVVIHGGARGADTLAGKAAEALGMQIRVYKAYWHIHGRAAGPIRNRLMFDTEKPDVVLAFWDGESPGTKDMIAYARSRHCEVRIFHELPV